MQGLSVQGKGLQPQAQRVGTAIRPEEGREESTTAAPQRVVWGEGRGPPCPAGDSSERGSPRRAVGGTVCRWDRRRGAIAAWHDN